MEKYRYVDIREMPNIIDEASKWFSDKWKHPKEAYFSCMKEYLDGSTNLGWYVCLKDNNIIGGLGVIENDFHNRKDLTPNICAVYTEEMHRGKGIAGNLLNMAVSGLKSKNISPVYLVTDHIGFYEQYGWKFLCDVMCDGEDKPSRMYVHK